MASFIWDENEVNMEKPSITLFQNGFPLNDPPTSANINWVFNGLSVNREPIGMIDFFAGSVAPDGWLISDGSTIAKSNTSATHYGDEYEGLFTLLWLSFAGSVISPSRGSSAAADWTADKTITIPSIPGYTMAGRNYVTGSIFNAAVGTYVGEENVALSVDQLPQLNFEITDPEHDHTIISGSETGAGGETIREEVTIQDGLPRTSSSATGITVNPLGGGQAHNNVPPSLLVNAIIKY